MIESKFVLGSKSHSKSHVIWFCSGKNDHMNNSCPSKKANYKGPKAMWVPKTISRAPCSFVSLKLTLTREQWHLGSGCSRHMTGNISYFIETSHARTCFMKIICLSIFEAEVVNTARYIMNRVLLRPLTRKWPINYGIIENLTLATWRSWMQMFYFK